MMYVNIELIHCCAPGSDGDEDDTSLDEYSNMYVIVYEI